MDKLKELLAKGFFPLQKKFLSSLDKKYLHSNNHDGNNIIFSGF
ncbi:hypothetical protein [Photorhabdus khanii]|nr:hypothetical protein [Photorhabdus khanii]